MRKVNVKGSTLPKIKVKRVKVSYKIGTGALKPAIKIKIGQWWLYRDSKTWDWPEITDGLHWKAALVLIPDRICAVAVTDIISGQYGGEEIKVEFMIATPKFAPFEQGDTAWFIDQNFSAQEGYFTPYWDPDDGLVYKNNTKPLPITYGLDCTKCKKHYPYAVRTSDFECWSCRNGY